MSELLQAIGVIILAAVPLYGFGFLLFKGRLKRLETFISRLLGGN